MIRPQHASLRLASVEVRTPSFQRIPSQTAASKERLHVFIGSSVGSVVELTHELIGRWLSAFFGEQFVESRTDTANEFGIDVFGEVLDHGFAAHGAFIAAVGMLRGSEPRRTRSTPLRPIDGAAQFFELLNNLGPIKLISHGWAHVYLNPKSGRAQVWLEQLPGSIEFVAAGRRRRPTTSGSDPCRRVEGNTSRAGISMRGQQAVAWYGLGVPNGDPAEIIENFEQQLKRKSKRIINRGSHPPNVSPR